MLDLKDGEKEKHQVLADLLQNSDKVQFLIIKYLFYFKIWITTFVSCRNLCIKVT